MIIRLFALGADQLDQWTLNLFLDLTFLGHDSELMMNVSAWIPDPDSSLRSGMTKGGEPGCFTLSLDPSLRSG
jgi:hypothetical protein